jgi:hypothetical protein
MFICLISHQSAVFFSRTYQSPTTSQQYIFILEQINTTNQPSIIFCCGFSIAHYRKHSLHRESGASPRAKPPTHGEASLRREQMFWLSAKDWPTVKSPFAESFLLSALGEGFG